ncbi:MAG: putative pachytene checkpoint protein 2, partial [Streblomastix strix]
FSGSTDQIEKNVRETIAQQCPIIRLGPVDFSKNSFLCQNVEQIAFTDLDEIAPDSDVILLWQVQLDIYMYSCEESGATEDADNGGEEGDNTPSCMQWTLPNNELEGSWENLIYEVGLKRRLLNYVKSALLFSERGVNPHIIGCN